MATYQPTYGNLPTYLWQPTHLPMASQVVGLFAKQVAEQVVSRHYLPMVTYQWHHKLLSFPNAIQATE